MTEGSLYSTSSLRICYFHGSMYIADMYFYFFQTGYEVAEGYTGLAVLPHCARAFGWKPAGSNMPAQTGFVRGF